MDIQFDDLSLSELKDLRRKLDKAISGFEARQKKKAVEMLQNVARDHGLNISDLIEAAQSGPSRGGLPPRFANPDNPEDTWSGRGRKPHWYISAIANGSSPDDLKIG